MAKGQGRRISGIFIPIELDTSRMQESIKKVNTQLSGLASTIITSLDRNLNINTTVRSFDSLYRSIGNAKNAAKALSTVKSGDFFNDLEASEAELKELAKTFGITTEAQKEFLQEIYKTQAINQEVNSVRALSRSLGMATEDFIEFAKVRGISFSGEALDKLIPERTVQRVDALTKSYKELVATSGALATTEGLKKFIDANLIKEAVNASRQLNNSQKITKQQFIEIAQATNTTTAQVKEYIKQMDKAGRSGRNLFVSAFTPSNITAALQSSASAFGVVGGAYGIAELTKSAYQASMKMENLNLAFKSVYGSADIANEKLQYVKQISDELGLSFLVTADGAKKLFAAAKGTVLENQAENILKAFSTMGAALKLTGSEMESVFLAISQILSKGKVSAEELRLQLAERMPGAVTLFARAIGVSTSELDAMLQAGQVGLKEMAKFAELVQETYADGAREASKGLQAELNRVSNAWFNLKQSFVNTEGTAGVLRGITDGLKLLTDFAPAITTTASALVGFATSAGIAYGAIKILSFASPIASAIKFRAELLLALPAIEAFKLAMSETGRQANQLKTRFGQLINVLSGYKFLIAGAIFAAVYNYISAETEAEEVLNKYTKTLDDYIDVAKRRVEADKEVESQIKRTKQSLEEAARADISTLFSNFGGWGKYDVEGVSGFASSLYNLIPTFTFDGELKGKLFKEFSKVSEIGKSFSEQLLSGIDKGLSDEELYKMLDKVAIAFEETRASMKAYGADEGIIKEYNELIGSFIAVHEKAITTRRKFEKELNSLGVSIDFSSLFNGLKEIASITKTSDIGKAQKIEQETEALAKNIFALAKQKDAIDNLLTSEQASEDLKKQAVTTLGQYEEALGSIPSYLTKNNIAMKDFIAKIEELEKSSAESGSKIQQFFTTSMSIISEWANTGKISLEMIKNKFSEMDSSKPDNFISSMLKKAFQKEALNELEKNITEFEQDANMRILKASQPKSVIATVEFLKNDLKATASAQDLAEAVKAAVQGKDVVIELNSGIQVTDEHLRRIVSSFKDMDATSLGNIKENVSKASKALATYGDKLEKVKADLLGSKSEKYEVTVARDLANIDKIIASGKGTASELARLKVLRAEYAKYTQERIKQIEELQRIQGAEEMGEAIRRTNQELLELTGQGRAARLAIIESDYEAELALWEEFKVKYNLSQEEFNARVLELQKVRDMKMLEESRSVNDQMKLTLDSWFSEYENIAPQIADFTTDAFRTAADAIGDFAASGLRDIDSLGDAFSNMADQMLQTAARMFSNQMFSSMFQWFGGGTSGSGLFSWLFSAKGNVFANSPNLHKFSNSVINKPTLFNYGTHVKAYAKGAGLMGEAGPEAVVPLVRTSSGHLGVRTTGESSGTNVYVNVINKSDAQVSTRESQDSQGNTNIEFLIERSVGQAMRRPGSEPYRALNNTYGANMRLANR